MQRREKALESLRQIDAAKTGTVKVNVFFNLLACLDLALSEEDEEEIKENHMAKSTLLVYYEHVMPRLKFDAIRDEWIYQG